MIEQIEILDCEQGSDEWREVKRGIPSASNFAKALAGGTGKTRDEYLRKLAGEIVSGQPMEDFRNGAMDRGNRMEPGLRAMYEMLSDNDVQQVGFVKRHMEYGPIGYSPDGFVGTDGIIEFKSAAPHILIDILRSDRVPPEHIPQCQGGLLVTGRKWCEIAIGYEGMPMFRRHMPRDEAMIQRMRVGLEAFMVDLWELVDWLRRYGK